MVTQRRVGRNQPLTRWFWTVILHAVAAEMFRMRRRGFVSKRVSRRHADEEEQSGLIIIITSMFHVYIRIYSLKANAVLFFLSRDHHAILVCLSRFLSLESLEKGVQGKTRFEKRRKRVRRRRRRRRRRVIQDFSSFFSRASEPLLLLLILILLFVWKRTQRERRERLSFIARALSLILLRSKRRETRALREQSKRRIDSKQRRFSNSNRALFLDNIYRI